MTHRRIGRCLAVVLFASLVTSSPLASEPVDNRPPAKPVELFFPHGPQPARLELRIEVDGQSVEAIWDETFARLMSYYDRDGDRMLDAVEAGRLPSAFALRAILWGQFATATGEPPPLEQIDQQRDGQVTIEELASFYRQAGLGGALVGAGRPPSTQRLSNALVANVDTNHDGKTDESEWKAAPHTLMKLDLNGDELIGAGELASNVSYPGARGSLLVRVPEDGIEQDDVSASLPFRVLSGRRDRGASPRPSLPSAKTEPPLTTVWLVRVGDAPGVEPSLASWGEAPPASGRLVLSHGSMRFSLRCDGGKLPAQIVAARKRFAAQFAESDLDSNRTLTAMELRATKAKLLQPLAASADRNGDGDLDAAEFSAWIELQAQIAKGHILLTVLDHGAGLFELLDADGDGALSVGELSLAWERIAAAHCVDEHGFSPASLPRHLAATISHGHPQSPLGRIRRPGPEWYLALDRNADGEVSIREWLDDLDLFRSLDVDANGRLTAAEALARPLPRER